VLEEKKNELGMVVCACHPSYAGGQDQKDQASLGKEFTRDPILMGKKNWV
jgi:hypothetical protein